MDNVCREFRLESGIDSAYKYFLSGSTASLSSVTFSGLSDMCVIYNYLFVSGHPLPMGRFLEDREDIYICCH